MKELIPLAEVQKLAMEVVQLLRPTEERIEIAGSIRRQKSMVRDIEIVCIPKMADINHNLFGDPTGRISYHFNRVLELVGEGIFENRLDVNGRPACGERFQRMLYKGFALDIFSVVPPAQFGLVFLIRTGPKDYSHNFVTPNHMGGKILKPGQHVEAGVLRDRGELVPMPEEADVYRYLETPFVAPEQRK